MSAPSEGLQVGDQVRVREGTPKTKFSGRVGEIVYIYDNRGHLPYAVEFAAGTYSCYAADELEVLP